jgi:hypothetical protein
LVRPIKPHQFAVIGRERLREPAVNISEAGTVSSTFFASHSVSAASVKAPGARLRQAKVAAKP